MVDAARVMRKLPSLLCKVATTEKSERARRHRIENELKRLQKNNAEKYYSLENRLIRDLNDLEKAVFEQYGNTFYSRTKKYPYA